MTRSSSRAALVAGIAFVVSLSSLTRPALARDDELTARSKKLFVEGTKQYDVGRFSDALSAFQEAYVTKPEPGILINIGQCQRMLGNHKQAIYQYRRFLDMAPPDHRMRPAVEELIASEEAVLKGEKEGAPVAVKAPDEQNVKPVTATVAVTTSSAVTQPVVVAPVVETHAATSPVVVQPVVTTTDVSRMAPPPDDEVRTVKPSAASGTPPRKPLYKQWWLWTIVGAVVVTAAVIGISVALTSGPNIQNGPTMFPPMGN